MIVELISPSNEKTLLNYYEVNEFCKLICCKEENRESFEIFKRDYNYFEPYFDYVMFELKYKMHNCLFENDYISCVNNKIYSSNFYSSIPYMVKCSDKSLKIVEIGDEILTSMIDPNGMQIMGYCEENDRGSHIMTARTILNQLLIQSQEICKHYYRYKTNPINELINMGFIRSLGSDVFETLICREELLTDNLKSKINMNSVSDYGFAEEIYFELLREYLNIMNKNEIVMHR